MNHRATILGSLLLLVTSAYGQVTGDHHDHFDMVFREADQDSDGRLDRNEFIRSFEVYDTNRDGVVTRKEYTDYNLLVMPHHMEIVDPMFSWYDMDKDGTLDRLDYIRFYPLMDTNDDTWVTEMEFHNYWIEVFHNLGLDHGDHSG